MTAEQEQQKIQEYRDRIAEGLRSASTEGYQGLCDLCEEAECLFLSARDRELTLFRRIMRIWDIERTLPATDTIIGRTAAFFDIPRENVTTKQLIDTYHFLRFALFRFESALPMEQQIEGVTRVMALGLSPGAILLAAEFETQNKDEVISRFAEILERKEVTAIWPRATVTAAILKGMTRQ